MSGVDAILQGILDAPTEAECRDRISAALESSVFWHCDDVYSGGLAAMKAAIVATQTFIISLALARLLRERDGYQRPVARWLATAAREPMAAVQTFVRSFDDEVIGEKIDFVDDRERFDAMEAMFARACERARRAGSQCYPARPELLIENFDGVDEHGDDVVVTREFDGDPIGVSYDERNDVLYVKRRGEECRRSRGSGDVVLSFAADGERVTGVTIIGAARGATWSTEPEHVEVPEDMRVAIDAWAAKR